MLGDIIASGNIERLTVLVLLLFTVLIIIESTYGLITRRNTYRLNDSISSLSQGVLSQITSIYTQFFQIGIYSIIFSSLCTFDNETFWGRWYGWIIAFIMADFFDYWAHRASHEISIFWAAHVVHHQSQSFNLSTALRQESLYPVVTWIFYLPMAILGVPPQNFAIILFGILFYQFWVHTEHIGRLGWFDYYFSSPSNHRVHHATNEQYINKNYGAVLIIWDRLFGTFAEENEKCVYGTVEPLNSWDPIWSIFHVFWKLVKVSWNAQDWEDKIKVFFKPPGWYPAYAKFQLNKVNKLKKRKVFNPKVNTQAMVFSSLNFLAIVIFLCFYLWNLETLSTMLSIAISIQMIISLWVIGAIMENKIRITNGLFIELFGFIGLFASNYLLYLVI